MEDQLSVSKYRLSPESIISTVFLSNLPIEKMRYHDMADLLYSLDEYGVDTSHMIMYMNAVHAYSDDLSHFLGKLHAFGFADDFDPVRLNDEGVRICKKIVDEEKIEPGAREQLEYLNGLLNNYTYENGKIMLKKKEPAKTKRKFLFW